MQVIEDHTSSLKVITFPFHFSVEIQISDKKYMHTLSCCMELFWREASLHLLREKKKKKREQTELYIQWQMHTILLETEQLEWQASFCP